MRTARKLAALMVKEFQPYGATWAELKNKSGMARATYKRAFNWATKQKWFVGGGKQGAPYYLNPDGCWRAALLGPSHDVRDELRSDPMAGTAELGSAPVRALDPKIDRHLALISEAIYDIDGKKH